MPWRPRPLAWVDLDKDGPRVIGAVEVGLAEIEIGLSVALACSVAWVDEQGREVVGYGFKAAHSRTEGAGSR
jgi:hypothetical protein